MLSFTAVLEIKTLKKIATSQAAVNENKHDLSMLIDSKL